MKLATFSALSFETFLRTFARANVLARWPGESSGKGAAFPLRQARRRAEILRRRFVGGRLVILLGLRTASAFGLSVGYFRRVRVGRAVAVVVPHPSGVNRWYNERANLRRMRAFMRAAARGAGR